MLKKEIASMRTRMARRRLQARELGVCCICCKHKPNLGRTVCVSCNAAKIERQKRKRQAKRETSGSAKLIEAHERAGDAAREHHVYELAAQHYEDALHVSNADESAWMRLSEKLAEVLWLDNEPGAASAVNDRLLATYRLHPERSAEHIKTLFRVTRWLWADSRTKDKIPVLSKAIRVAEFSNDLELLQHANIGMANTYMQLAHFEEADRYLRVVDQLHQTYNVNIPTGYYTQKGLIAAGLGREKEAFASFDRAIEVAGEDTDPYRTAMLWSEYGFVARVFGRTKLAKANFEHALLATRRSGIGWLIPLCCLEYAEFLTCIGAYTSAYEYLVEALSSDAQTPVLDERIAYVGIPLALYMKDEATLEKCVRPHVIDRAFLSGEPERIGHVAAAFARMYVERGESRKAQRLLHRAVQAMHSVTYALHLTLEIARCGAKTDFPKTRRLLEACVALPCAHVAQAYLQLFDAFVAQREGRRTDTHTQARGAVACFDGFEWGMYADLARSLLPLEEQRQIASEMHHTKPFSDMQTKFTEREREVAVLVLKGLTNRAIAGTLSITENTVEKHVAAVMNKLGIRSRYQLADAIAYTKAE
jgi:DNA-binding CsgD family transcriptional regulator/tetratricopeptide (TPR) repeat protein